VNGLIASASIVIDAPIGDVWAALTDAARAKKYMFGSDIATDWQVGSAITWSGVWNGKPYEDKGTIVRNEEGRVLEYTHYSPLTGKPDVPESYHAVRIELAPEGDGATKVVLTQDNNADEASRAHSEGNWRMMLESLKKEVEAGS
jgi:uncharacterized protein YndB with AHSA1/START domain